MVVVDIVNRNILDYVKHFNNMIFKQNKNAQVYNGETFDDPHKNVK